MSSLNHLIIIYLWKKNQMISGAFDPLMKQNGRRRGDLLLHRRAGVLPFGTFLWHGDIVAGTNILDPKAWDDGRPLKEFLLFFGRDPILGWP